VLRRQKLGRRGSTALPKIKWWPFAMVDVRKNLDLVWVWFYKDVAPTALFKGANPAKWHLTGKFYWQKLKC
jgi:hypothetical protein